MASTGPSSDSSSTSIPPDMTVLRFCSGLADLSSLLDQLRVFRDRKYASINTCREEYTNFLQAVVYYKRALNPDARIPRLTTLERWVRKPGSTCPVISHLQKLLERQDVCLEALEETYEEFEESLENLLEAISEAEESEGYDLLAPSLVDLIVTVENMTQSAVTIGQSYEDILPKVSPQDDQLLKDIRKEHIAARLRHLSSEPEDKAHKSERIPRFVFFFRDTPWTPKSIAHASFYTSTDSQGLDAELFDSDSES